MPMWLEWTIATRFLREGRAQSVLILVGIAVGGTAGPGGGDPPCLSTGPRKRCSGLSG